MSPVDLLAPWRSENAAVMSPVRPSAGTPLAGPARITKRMRPSSRSGKGPLGWTASGLQDGGDVAVVGCLGESTTRHRRPPSRRLVRLDAPTERPTGDVRRQHGGPPWPSKAIAPTRNRPVIELVTRSCESLLVGVTDVTIRPFVVAWATSRGSWTTSCGPDRAAAAGLTGAVAGPSPDRRPALYAASAVDYVRWSRRPEHSPASAPRSRTRVVRDGRRTRHRPGRRRRHAHRHPDRHCAPAPGRPRRAHRAGPTPQADRGAPRW